MADLWPGDLAADQVSGEHREPCDDSVDELKSSLVIVTLQRVELERVHQSLFDDWNDYDANAEKNREADDRQWSIEAAIVKCCNCDAL